MSDAGDGTEGWNPSSLPFFDAESFKLPSISSSATCSNLRGPGRNLGNLFSKTSPSVERFLGRFVLKVGLSKRARATKVFQRLRFPDREMSEREKTDICETLLKHARCVPDCYFLFFSLTEWGRNRNFPIIQSMAFQEIISRIILYPPLRRTFESCIQRRGERTEVALFSWKGRQRLIYSVGWLYIHEITSRCLTSNPVTDLADHFELENSWESSCFKELLLVCR